MHSVMTSSTLLMLNFTLKTSDASKA